MRMRIGITLGAFTFGIGCMTKEMVPPVIRAPITPAQLCAMRDSLVATATILDQDEYQVILAKLLPGGFGGTDGDYMFFKQPELTDTVRATARTIEACPH